MTPGQPLLLLLPPPRLLVLVLVRVLLRVRVLGRSCGSGGEDQAFQVVVVRRAGNA